jgi:hypothetical protein
VNDFSPRRKLLLGFLTVGIVYLAIEASCGVALVALHVFKGIDYDKAFSIDLDLTPEQVSQIERLVYGKPGVPVATLRDDGSKVQDAVLGWTSKRKADAPLYRINSQGIRGDHDFPIEPPADQVRIAAFGESFTFGSDVRNPDAWSIRLDELLPEAEVLNFGVGGYGPGQSYLRYLREGVAFSPDVVLFGYMSENLNRAVNVYRPFYLPRSWPASKPRFLLRGDDLVLLDNPLPGIEDFRRLLEHPREVQLAMGEHDYFFQKRYHHSPLQWLPSVRLFELVRRFRFNWYWDIVHFGVYDPASEAFRTTTRILQRFHDDAVANGSTPIILLFPDQENIAEFREVGRKEYGPLVEWLDGRMRYVDLMDAFDQLAPDRTADELCHGHYTPLGNDVVAHYLASYLRDNGLLAPPKR